MEHIELSKGMRFTNHLMEECIIVSIQKGIVRLRVLSKISYIQPWTKEDLRKAITGKLFVLLPLERVRRDNLSDHLYRYQLKMLGHDPAEELPKGIKFSERDLEDFKGYAILVIKKVMKCNRHKAIEILEYFNQVMGFTPND